jgi:hypothetical protein
MIACVSPHLHNCAETLNTLEYAARAKKITNKAIANERISTKAVLELHVPIDRLEAQLGRSSDRKKSRRMSVLEARITYLEEKLQVALSF